MNVIFTNQKPSLLQQSLKSVATHVNDAAAKEPPVISHMIIPSGMKLKPKFTHAKCVSGLTSQSNLIQHLLNKIDLQKIFTITFSDSHTAI